jgi:Mce-associated membrane protein
MTRASEHDIDSDALAGDEIDRVDLDALTPPSPPSRLSRGLRHWRRIGAGAALIGSAALAVGLYFGPHRIDQNEAAAQTAALTAASEGAVALLTYAPDTVEPDLAAAQSHLTGEFLTYYSDFAEQIVAPAAKDEAVHATATVVRAATADVDGNHAKVLVFLNQSTTSRDNPTAAQTASSVMVGMTDVDGRWLISSFDPL